MVSKKVNLRRICSIILSCVLLISTSGCNPPPTKKEITDKLAYKIDYSDISNRLEKIKNSEHYEPKKSDTFKIQSVNLVADTSGSMGRFLGDSLTTYTNVLSALSDVFSGVSLTCYEIPNMNTGGDLNLEAFPASRIEDWRSPDSYTYDGGTDLYALTQLVIDDMNSKNSDGNLYVIISDITPQPVLGSGNILSSERQLNDIGELLVKNVIQKSGYSVGIIGIQADRAGNLSGLPDKSQREADGKLNANPFFVAANDIPSTGGVYKSPMYLLFIGNELVVQDSVNRIKSKIAERVGPADEELKSYVVQRIEIRARETFDKSSIDDKLKLPKVKLSSDFSQYALLDRIEPLSVYSDNYEEYEEIRLRLEETDIPFYRLYDANRYGKDADVTVEAGIPYSLMLIPDNREIPISSEFLDLETAQTDVKHFGGRDEEGEPPDATELLTGKVIERKDFKFTGAAGGSASWSFNLELNPNELRLDEPLVFATEVKTPLKSDKVYDLVSEAISSEADWLFDDIAEDSWSLNIPEYWTYRENGGQYTQADKTPYLSTLFRTIRNEIAQNVSEGLCKKSADYTRTAMFGVVVRDSVTSYYPKNVKNRVEDPYNISFNKEHIEILEGIGPE